MVKELFLVTGASGKLGLSFVEELKKDDKRVLGLVRGSSQIEGIQMIKADLLDENQILRAFEGFDFSPFDTITLIHPVGMFKFEGNPSSVVSVNKDGIDDEIYATNVLTLKNTLKILLSRLNRNQLVKVCTFASISDRYNVPFWRSYTKSKNIIRVYLKDLCEQGCVHALMVNVSTVDTGNENILRPKADKTYWLQPREIVSRALLELGNIFSYKEIDVYKEKPGFSENYYLDHEAILKKWTKEMDKE